MAELSNSHAASEQATVILASLDDLLDRERIALLNGDLDAISRGLREKERLIDALNALHGDQDDDLSAIRNKAQRNQILLESALSGIRAVADRVAALRRVRDTLETYDQSGRKTAISTLRTGQVEKRA
ncbi:MAG: flagellar biosynthesis protein FlgN [Paracoccaceae bacterium]